MNGQGSRWRSWSQPHVQTSQDRDRSNGREESGLVGANGTSRSHQGKLETSPFILIGLYVPHNSWLYIGLAVTICKWMYISVFSISMRLSPSKGETLQDLCTPGIS